MDFLVELKAINKEFYFTILTVIIVYAAYHFISSSNKIKHSFINKLGEEKAKVYFILFNKLLGFALFGIIPLIIVFVIFKSPVILYGIKANFELLSIGIVLGLIPILIVISYYNSLKGKDLSTYPQIRKKEWNLKLLMLSFLSWAFYLLGYEFLFRGFLLFVSERAIGIEAAIVLNILIYALVHLPKGMKETIGAVPFGLILCVITLYSGNFYSAFILHLVFALSNEWFSLKANSDMNLIIKK